MSRHASARARRSVLALILSAALAVVVGAAVFAGVNGWSPGPGPAQQNNPSAAPTTSLPTTDANTSSEPQPEPTSSAPPIEVGFTILAGGDVLPHEPVHISARTSSGYNFSPLLAGIDEWVAGADLALCHLEVPTVPDGQRISGYPMFAAAPEVLTALAKQGWTGCSTASNHSVDRKFAGIEKTLDVMDDLGLGHVGTARTEAEAEQPQLYTVTIQGVETTVAHLSATYGTNGLPIPEGKPWSVELIDSDRLIAQATAARAAGADLVLVSIHAGNEYQTAPTDQQLDVARELAASGTVDLMIGHHAHVPQRMDRLKGGPGDAGMFVAYGLGNMLSNQDTQCCVAQTNSGLLLTAEVRHVEGEPARIDAMQWVGTTVDRLNRHRLHALPDVTEGTGKLSRAEVGKRYERVRDAAGDALPERTAPPEPADADVRVVPRTRTN